MSTKTILLLVGLFAQIVYGQTENLQIRTESEAGNTINWQTTVTVTVPSGIRNSFLLELPAGLLMIPVSVTQNDRSLWLQNSGQPAAIDSAVSWQTTDQGLVFLFRDGQLNNGERLQITTMTTLSGKRPDAQAVISLRPFNPGQPAGAPAASVALPSEWTQPGQ
jgi:hypothetical protein